MKNRRNLKCVIGAAFMLLFCETTFSQVNLAPPPGKIKETIISAELRYLSSPFFEGRKTGERGNEMAADFLELYFNEIGLEPFRSVRLPKADPRYNKENSSFCQYVLLFRFTVPEEYPLTVVTRMPAGEKRTEFRFGDIIGCIPGEIPDDCIIVGAHYDHLGKTAEESYSGSDDNASCVVAVMAIARTCKEMKIKPKRTIIFALWTAEEEGLLGSQFFLDKWTNGKIDACFNFDMVSRYNPKDSLNFLTVTLPKGFDSMRETIGKINKADSLDLKVRYTFEEESDYGGSDYAPFAVKGIPSCWFFTGFHPDYHKETDIYDNANMEAMTRIVELGYRTVWERSNRV